jgi:HEAT repeat protein
MVDFDRERRRAAVLHFLDTAGSAQGIASLAERWAPDESHRLLLLRSLGEAGDERVLAYLAAEIAEAATPRIRGEASSAFFVLQVHDTLAEHLFAKDGRVIPRAAWGRLPLAELRASLVSRDGNGLGVIAVHALGKAGDAEAIPILEHMLQTCAPIDPAAGGDGCRVDRAMALVRLGRPAYLCELVDLFGIERHEIQDGIPSFVIAESRRSPLEGARCLARGLDAPEPLARIVSAYVAGQIPLPALADALEVRAHDPDTAVRAAADWALQRIRVAAVAEASPTR